MLHNNRSFICLQKMGKKEMMTNRYNCTVYGCVCDEFEFQFIRVVCFQEGCWIWWTKQNLECVEFNYVTISCTIPKLHCHHLSEWTIWQKKSLPEPSSIEAFHSICSLRSFSHHQTSGVWYDRWSVKAFLLSSGMIHRAMVSRQPS